MSEHAFGIEPRKTRKTSRTVRFEMTEAEAAEAKRLIASFDHRLTQAEARIERVLDRIAAAKR